MRLNKYLLALPATLLASLPLLASDPPAARLMDPPAAYSIDPPAALVEATPEPKYDPRAATCVVNWKQYLGSGTCIASEGGKSLVLTCNHVWSEQPYENAPFPLGNYPLLGEVRHDGKKYTATAIGGDEKADLALVVVDATLPVARIAENDPEIGSAVRHYGYTSKDTSGTALPTRRNYVNPSSQFTFTAAAIEGDSGAGVFNENGELVAVVCGRVGAAKTEHGRGTTVSVVRSVVVQRTRAFPHLFPRLRDRLAARGASNAVPVALPDPPAAVAPKAASVPPCGCGCMETGSCKCKNCADRTADPNWKATPVAPKKVNADPVSPCPASTCPLSSAQFGGTVYSYPGAGSSCANGSCAQPALRRGLLRR